MPDIPPILDRVKAALPGLADAAAAHRTASAWLRSVPPTTDDTAAAIEVCLDALRSGAERPDDIGQMVLEVRRENERRLAERAALDRVIREAAELERHAGDADSTEAYDVLRDELALIMAEVFDANRALDGVDSPAAAVAAGDDAVAVWRHLAALVERYSDLRRAQRWLVRAPTVSGFTNAHELLRAVDLAGIVENAAEVDYEPAAAYDVDHLRWLVTSGARAWIPGPDQLMAAFGAALEHQATKPRTRTLASSTWA